MSPHPRRATSISELLQAVGVLVALLVAFLWQPLTTNGYYAPSDLLQSSPLVRTAPDGYRFGNVLLTDPVQQMHPWLEWNREHVRRGDMPVWNPYNAGGTPHLASMVSAVLSPFSVPFYLLGFRAALVVAAALKLLVLGLATYLFLRRVKVSHLGGLVGAVAFMFSGFNVLWLSWPHAAATIGMPIGLWLAEVALARGTSPFRARLAWAGYALSVTASFLGGHPETIFFSWGLVLAYVPLRLLLSADLRAAGRRLRHLGSFAFASVLGVGLAGVQLLPFWEYLQRSTSYVEGAKRASVHFEVRFSALHAFPNLFGAPSQHYYDPSQLFGALRFGDAPIQSNYNESSSFYIGLVVLLLAGIAVVSLLRRRRFAPVFLAVAAAIWFVYANDLGRLSRFVDSLPLVELSPRNRSHPIWLFSLACLAGLGADVVRRAAWGPLRRRLAVVVGLGAGTTFLLAAAFGAKRYILERTATFAGSLGSTPLASSSVRAHVTWVVVTFLAGVVALVALAAAGRDQRARIGAGVVLVVAVFAQSGWMLRDYNPTIAPGYFFPEAPGIEALQDTVGSDVVTLGVLLSADTNVWYRVRVPDSYDGLGVYRSELLRRRLQTLAAPGTPESLLVANDKILDTLGIRYIASQTYPFAVPASALPASPSFTATQDGMRAMSVYAVPAAGASMAGCSVTLDLVDDATGQSAAQGTAPCRLPFTTVDFAPVAGSAGRHFTARFGGTGQVGGLVPWAGGLPGIRQVDGADRVALFVNPSSPPRYFSPASARAAGPDRAALRQVVDPGFRLSSTALIHAPVAPSDGSPGTVEVLRERDTETKLRVTRGDPGWLVALQTWYPGWEATVGGKAVPLRRADYAYSAVAVPAGTSEVVLRYRPSSLRHGLMATSASGAALALWMVVPPAWAGASRNRRQRRGGRSEPPSEPAETLIDGSQVPHNSE